MSKVTAFRKYWLKHPRMQVFLAYVLSFYIRLVNRTCHKSYLIDPKAAPFFKGEQNGIFAFWHGRMMMLPISLPPGRIMRVLISFHRDGLLISRIIKHFGLSTIGGSSSRGGALAAQEILRALESGDNASITPDGPRGPGQTAAPGIITIARLAGKPILPVTFAASRHFIFKNSWDQFLLALPFGTLTYSIGAPIWVAESASESDEEQARLALEQSMNHLQLAADQRLKPAGR